MRRIPAWIALAVALALPGACTDEAGRFPVCRSDNECVERDKAKPICENLRCVECAYDRHCQELGKGDTCNRQTSTCVRL